jgi:hypothetical protein
MHYAHYPGMAGMEVHSAVPRTLAEVGHGRQMEAQLELWRGYQSLDRIARRLGCRIENATRGGFLDVFPRVTFEAVVTMSSGGETGDHSNR